MPDPRLPIDLPPVDTAKLDTMRAIFLLELRQLVDRKRREPPYPDSELVAILIPPGGYPLTMFGAMLEGIGRRYPDAAWVVNHGFGDGPFVMHLGESVEPDEDWDDDLDDVAVTGGLL